MALLYKNKKEGGSMRASPVAAPMPKFFPERKYGLLRERMCCVCLRFSMRTFHRWGGLIFIVDVIPVGW